MQVCRAFNVTAHLQETESVCVHACVCVCVSDRVRVKAHMSLLDPTVIYERVDMLESHWGK